MSRFADASAIETLTLGPCQCPGTPHEEDVVIYRTALGAGEEDAAGAAGWAATNGKYFDWEAARSKLLATGVLRWNLLGPSGELMPVTPTAMALLDSVTRAAIGGVIDAAQTKARGDPLPNASAARSRAGSRASGSRTRTTRTKS
jgi:hypothetical protein